MAEAYLILGSNIGNREQTMHSAIEEINSELGKVIDFSSFYETAPWGYEDDRMYLNLVVKIRTSLNPEFLLEKIHQIERKFGRTRSLMSQYEARTLDIDILFYDDLILQQPNLSIPHSRLHKRRFTLIPLAEIAPSFKHPLLEKSVSQLLFDCPDNSDVKRFMPEYKYQLL